MISPYGKPYFKLINCKILLNDYSRQIVQDFYAIPPDMVIIDALLINGKLDKALDNLNQLLAILGILNYLL